MFTANAVGPVEKPPTCRRPERIASISAAFDWTWKNTTRLPVHLERWSVNGRNACS